MALEKFDDSAIYNPLLSGGSEFMQGDSENVSGRDGDAQRLQMSLMYNF